MPTPSELRDCLPSEVRTALEPVPDEALGACLLLLHAVPDTLRWLPTHLVLFALYAAERCPGCPEVVQREPRREFRRGPRLLLELLDLPAAPWVLRVLRKVSPDCLTCGPRGWLLRVLRDSEPGLRKVLQHLPLIRPVALYLMCHPALRSRVTVPFLAEAQRTYPTMEALMQALDHVLAWAYDFGDALPQRLKALEQLVRACERFHRQVLLLPSNQVAELAPTGPLAPPPSAATTVAGSPPIELRPLMSHEEVRASGRRSAHCTAGSEPRYALLAQSGGAALYEIAVRVQGVEILGTAFIVAGATGWELDEAELSRSVAIPPGMQEDVECRLVRFAQDLPRPPVRLPIHSVVDSLPGPGWREVMPPMDLDAPASNAVCLANGHRLAHVVWLDPNRPVGVRHLQRALREFAHVYDREWRTPVQFVALIAPGGWTPGAVEIASERHRPQCALLTPHDECLRVDATTMRLRPADLELIASLSCPCPIDPESP